MRIFPIPHFGFCSPFSPIVSFIYWTSCSCNLAYNVIFYLLVCWIIPLLATAHHVSSINTTTTTTTKPFVPSIWGRLHEPKENYAGSGTWISFLHSFLSSSMASLRPLASISCRITSIHVFFGDPALF